MTDSKRILDCIRRLDRLSRKTDREIRRKLGLSAAQLAVLQALRERAPLSQIELAALTCTDQSSVSVVIGRLADAGYVTKQRDPRDGRRLVVTLTGSGEALAARVPAAAHVQIMTVLQKWPEIESQCFADSFDRIITLCLDERKDLRDSSGAKSAEAHRASGPAPSAPEP